MGNMKYFENMINESLLSLNVAYIGKVLSYSNGKAKIQPLTMIKQYGKSAVKPSPLPNVPVIDSARYKLKSKTITAVTGVSVSGDKANVTETKYTVAEPVPIGAGDIVVCVCCDRDITETKNGNMATPPIGHHSMSDSVVVGIL